MATKTKAKAKRGSRKKKFPVPGDIPENVGVTYKSREDIMDIYRQATMDTKAKNVSLRVQQWVEATAKANGWGEVWWPKNYPKPTLSGGTVFVKGTVTPK